MIRACTFFLVVMAFTLRGAETNVVEKPHVVAVIGAAGERQYGEIFANWAMRVKDAAKTAGAEFTLIGVGELGEKKDGELLKESLTSLKSESQQELWLVLIGHGTYNGREAKFNLRGPDVTAKQIDEWLKPLKRPVAIINCASSSGPFLDRLKGRDRVIISATKSGGEQNFARFGDFFTDALSDMSADLDKDEQVSLLEMFITASKGAYGHYDNIGKLATEHALIDDNGDGLGSRAEWFRGVRATKRASNGKSLDGYRAHQLHLIRSEFETNLSPELRAERDRLEMSLNRHRERKKRMKEKLYYSQLEMILVQIGEIYQQAEKAMAKKAEAKVEEKPDKPSPKPKKPTESKKKPAPAKAEAKAKVAK
ncbi:MAG: hypothetical protein ACPGVU_01205 [Limisphaerales bacterium]